MYNLAHRHDDDLIDDLAAEGVAYVPFFPLGGFTPLQSSALSAVATRWKRRRCPSPWPGSCSGRRTSCSSPARLLSNTCARTSTPRNSALRRDLAELDRIAAKAGPAADEV